MKEKKEGGIGLAEGEGAALKMAAAMAAKCPSSWAGQRALAIQRHRTLEAASRRQSAGVMSIGEAIALISSGYVIWPGVVKMA